MKVFVTGVGGQLGHDVMNELHKRGFEGIGSDLAPSYSGVADGSAVTEMPYVSLDITDAESVRKHLIEKYSIGTIVLSGLIRLAFSTIPKSKLAGLFANVHAAINDLRA